MTLTIAIESKIVLLAIQFLVNRLQTAKVSIFHRLRILPIIMIDRPSSSRKTKRDKSSISPHIHDEESSRLIINRLSRIEGHVRGIKTMVSENRPCPEVLNQIAAVKGAISSVAKIVLEDHLEQCLIRAADRGNLEAEIIELRDALNRFLP